MYLQPSPCLSSRTNWLERLETTTTTMTLSWPQEQQQLLQDFVGGGGGGGNGICSSNSSSRVSAIATIMAAKKKQAFWEIQVIRDQIMSTTETMGQVLREITKNGGGAACHHTGSHQPHRQDWEVAHRMAMELDCLEYKLNILVKSYRLQHGEEPPAPQLIFFNTFGLTMPDIWQHFQLYNRSDLARKETDELYSILVQLDNGKYHENDDLIEHWQAQSDEWKTKFGCVPAIQTDFAENREVLIERIVAYLYLSDE